MAFFRDDEKLIELTVDDRLEIFNTILVGSSDVTVKLFNELLGDYNVADLSILQSEVDSWKKFVEVFKTLTDSPTNTVNGLWAELFLIDTSSNPKTLINYWHNLTEEKFDFNAGTERIEVKSSSNFERKHIFSAEQLNPPSDTQVLIASVFLKQHNSGNNIQQLIESISEQIDYDFETTDKLNSIVFRTLGSSLEHSIGVKFDYEIARQSLQF